MASCVLGPVERRVYKGVDTGERVLRLRPRLAVPRWLWLEGSRVFVKVIHPEGVRGLSLSRRKSFRSHISVQLMPVSEDSPLPVYAPGGSVPYIPVIPNSTESQVSFASRTSTSTPNIFQDTPFLFPQTGAVDSPGLRRINSVLGTMSLGDSKDEPRGRSSSNPPTATLSTRKSVSDGDTAAAGGTCGSVSPNNTRKASLRSKSLRKISKAAESSKANTETSSSDQDSPQKLGRRKQSLVYFKRPGAGILNRTISTDQTDGTGYDATGSERERSNSDLSSRLSICKRKLSTTGRENSKVPWCGCWGNGCI